MKSKKLIQSAVFSLFAFSAGSAMAVPALWESNFGDEITDLSGEDDEISNVSLSFLFPFAGDTYSDFAVGTNGGVQALDNAGLAGNDDDIDYDLWADLDEFLGDGSPLFTPFNTDLSLEDSGSIHFNDFGDRAVFTWNEVGSALNPDHLASFQLQLLDIGQIIFSYNGIFDDAGESLFDSLDEGIVTGISAGDFGPNSLADLSVGDNTGASTVFEQWCFDSVDSCDQFTGASNDFFDLDQMSLVFSPNSSGGFNVSAQANSVSAPSMAAIVALSYLMFLRRRSNKP